MAGLRIVALLGLLVSCSALLAKNRDQHRTQKAKYEPRACANMSADGHCKDENGGAWSYRGQNGKCAHTEKTVPGNPTQDAFSRALPSLFPDVKSVMDFGGGPGAFLLSYRDAGLTDLTTFEPHELGECLFHGLHQNTTDIVNAPLEKIPAQRYDMVQTIEVLEHIPATMHPKLVKALAKSTKKWLLFSAAHPDQPGEGHIGPSMKTPDEWRKEIEVEGSMEFDAEKTAKAHELTEPKSILETNLMVFRKRSPAMVK